MKLSIEHEINQRIRINHSIIKKKKKDKGEFLVSILDITDTPKILVLRALFLNSVCHLIYVLCMSIQSFYKKYNKSSF